MTPQVFLHARAQILRAAAAGLLVLVGVLALGTGLAHADASASGTATRAADDSVSGTVTAVDLVSPDGTTYVARYNGVDVGTEDSTGGEVTIPFDIPAGPDGVPASDCSALITVTDDALDAPLADVPITNCGGQTTPPTTTSPSTTAPTTTARSTTTSASGTTTATSTPATTPATSGATTTAYVPGPGGTGDGAGSDPARVGLGALFLLGAAGLVAVPILRRR